MCDSPDMAGDLFAASLTRRAVDLPYKAGSIMGIADAMREKPAMAGDTHAASLTRRAVDLPHKAGSIMGIADAMRKTCNGR
jgi:hypothetical protein